MDILYTIVTVLAIVVSLAENGLGLSCYWCTYNKVETDTPGVGLLLNAISKLSDIECKMEKETDIHEVGIRTCPDPGEGKVSKCAILNGTVTANLDLLLTKVQIRYHTLSRDCIAVEPEHSEFSNGCHDDLPSTTHSMLDKTFQGVNLGDVRFKGKACYYEDLTAGSKMILPHNILVVTMATLGLITVYFLDKH